MLDDVIVSITSVPTRPRVQVDTAVWPDCCLCAPAWETSEKIETRPNEEARCWP